MESRGTGDRVTGRAENRKGGEQEGGRTERRENSINRVTGGFAGKEDCCYFCVYGDKRAKSNDSCKAKRRAGWPGGVKPDGYPQGD